MTRLPEEVKRKVWKRDKYRCQECGLPVAQLRGLLPQTHHRARRPLGDDSPKNLITLCLCCHATKSTAGHRRIFGASGTPERKANFVKWSLWELAGNLLADAELIDPRGFAATSVADTLKKLRAALDSVITLTEDLRQFEAPSLEYPGADRVDQRELLETVVEGLRVGWWAMQTSENLERLLRFRNTGVHTKNSVSVEFDGVSGLGRRSGRNRTLARFAER